METNLTKKARELAIDSHKNQMYGKFPYIFHLIDVVRNLVRFGYDDEEMIVAAYLHDTLEDTTLTKFDISKIFGEKIADLVFNVTGIGKNRKERSQDTLNKLQNNNKAVVLKMADRLANVMNSYENNKRLLEMYKKEHVKYDALFEKINPKMNAEIKRFLDIL